MIELIPMNTQQFIRFREQSMHEFAAEKVAAGEWAETEALQQALQSFSKYLPDGLETEGAYIYNVHDGERHEDVGYVWVQVNETPRGKLAFIYDIQIHEVYQNRGYGTQTMYVLERAMRQQQVHRIDLHVFGHNDRALHVYYKAGYHITDYHMSKTLS
ncbi:GNAT family N-acetyltransferase [Paenibacillus campi]|uniref:GNAT family N-acetyltransferase n=1 Tax=Paenibacillus campi TaxID=3106031 RepID=UPI002AFF299D|nr:GNAT family N-acetyltransferase [Paenibacillus sp. SGZ-1009]